jgi:hypothetical protein
MIHILDKRIADHWNYFGQVLARAESFCLEYDSDADPAILSEILTTHFAQGSSNMLFLASVIDDVVVAHLIASIDTWCGAKYATILQYEANRGEMPYVDKREGMRILESWAIRQGADLQILARNPQMANLFRRYWGFSPVRILMRKRIS